MGSEPEWRVIPSRPDYEVSSEGLVRRVTPGHGATVGRILKQGLSDDGYAAVAIGGRIRRVHGLVAEAFLGPRPIGQEVRHRDGDRLNPRVENLIYGTRAENVEDTLLHGTRYQGTRVWSAVLDESRVRSIRRRAAQGERQVDLALEFGVSAATLSEIVSRKVWKHVPPEDGD